MPAHLGPAMVRPRSAASFKQRLVARHAGGARLGKAAGQDQQVADAAVGRWPGRPRGSSGRITITARSTAGSMAAIEGH